MKIKVILENEQGHTIEVDVEDSIVAEQGLVEYKKEIYTYAGILNSYSDAALTKSQHMYQKVRMPAFIG